MSEIINVNLINKMLDLQVDDSRVEVILDKALQLKGLSLEDSAELLNVEDEVTLKKIFKAAKKLKETIYGKRIVMFAPLYVTNHCVNNCLYCGFRVTNTKMKRMMLSPDEVVEEAEKIIEMGHKRILLVAGEDVTRCNLDYVQKIIDKIYEKKVMNGEIRRLNLNMAPLEVNEFKRLAGMGIGTFQSFQETYDPEVYKKMHISGPKSDYQWRLGTMDRAIEGGIQDFGIGALFGLTDYRFEVLATLMHADYLERTYGVGPHTISVPRIEYAEGSDVAKNPPHAINDVQFKKIIAILRLSVPYTGLILTTRENAEVRRECLELGVSQISAGSKTNPGGYSAKESTEQFSTGDRRSIDEVVKELADNDFMPSFCTSCYRKGRIGKDFMDLAKPGLIKRFCNSNAILTFREYLEDYASEETKEAGFESIQRALSEIEDYKIRQEVIAKLAKIESGERDIYI